MLRSVVCRANALTEISAELGKCWRLTELDLAGNQIMRLPYELGWLGSVLTRLDVSHNPIWSPPPEVVDLGTGEMLRWGACFCFQQPYCLLELKTPFINPKPVL